jgi:hypothetical protein
MAGRTVVKMLPKPIWPMHYLRYNGPRPMPPTERPLDKEAEAERHTERRRLAPPTDIWVYSDGSMKGRNTGAGWAVYQGDIVLSEGRKNCGRWMEVADAEAEAALEGMEAALKHVPPGRTNLWLCLDNGSKESIPQRTGSERHSRLSTRSGSGYAVGLSVAVGRRCGCQGTQACKVTKKQIA